MRRLDIARRRLGDWLGGGTPGGGDSPLAGATPEDAAILEHAAPFTMTSFERLQANIDAVRYCLRRGVPGAIVECGVWRGGSVLAMILALQEFGVDDREVFLYDTFEGMTEPTEADVSTVSGSALNAWNDAAGRNERMQSELFAEDIYDVDSVRETVLSSGYPAERVHLVQGDVMETIPAVAPSEIALLRLDTDWHASTAHELEHLYPRIQAAGVLIIDDYGHWDGARRAVDDYFADQPPILLHRTDYTGRIGIKA